MVKTHDFADKQLGKVIPYGVYDLSLNQGWVSVGIDHDEGRYPTGIEITDQQFDSIHLEKDDFYGEWNYRILPQAT